MEELAPTRYIRYIEVPDPATVATDKVFESNYRERERVCPEGGKILQQKRLGAAVVSKRIR